MGLAEVVFGVVCLAALAGLLRGQLTATRDLRRSRARAAEVADIDTSGLARRAAQAERDRLAGEISFGFGAALEAISEASERARQRLEGGGDPSAALDEIHGQARRAASELRRQLGLLRPVDGTGAPCVERKDALAPSRAPSVRAARPESSCGSGGALVLGWSDIWLALVTVGLAGVESIAQGRVESGTAHAATVVLTLGAAVGVLFRRGAPQVAAIWVALVYLAALLVGHPVAAGFWMIVTVGTVLWSVVQRTSRGSALTGCLLVGSTVLSTFVRDRENTTAAVVLVVVVAVGSALRRRTRGRERRSARVVAEHEARMVAARTKAAQQERLALARDLHDVVSHVIALVAVQSSAAAVTWRRSPEAALASLAVIDESVRRARTDLRRAAPTPWPVPPDEVQLEPLIVRAREAGLTVSYTGPHRMVGPQAPVVHRVLQESITNVLRHAAGAHVEALVRCQEGFVEVIVEDDGPGMPSDAVPGFGLIGLRERVELAGGTVHIGSGDNGGQRVAARVPAPSALSEAAGCRP